MSAELFNPLTPEYLADPYSTFRTLQTQAPIYYSEWMKAWILTRYAESLRVLRDNRFGRDSSYSEQMPDSIKPLMQMQRHWMLLKNPPDHTRLRSLVNTAFTPRTIERLRPHIQEIAEGLIDALADRHQMDLIADFAFPLPVIVIAELLGVPAADRDRIKAWSTVLAGTIDVNDSMDVYVEGARVTGEISAYLREIIGQRRRQPQDDLISELIAAEAEGQKLTEEELVATCILLLVAGHETTVNLIGNGMLNLLRHPDQLALLRRRPDLVDSAVEELLRYESPVQMTSRNALVDAEIGGQPIKAGQQVLVILGAANRDPAVFAEPDRLDITRASNQHLAFAVGIHYCVGASLARAEGQIALATLLRRLPELALARGELQWRRSVIFRGLQALPVTF